MKRGTTGEITTKSPPPPPHHPQTVFKRTTFCFVQTLLVLVLLMGSFNLWVPSKGSFNGFLPRVPLISCWSFQSGAPHQCKVLDHKLCSLNIFYQQYTYFTDRKNYYTLRQNFPTFSHDLSMVVGVTHKDQHFSVVCKV